MTAIWQAPWLLMIETDYVWMRPLQAPAAEDPTSRPMAYPFNYIVPTAPALEGVMHKMYPAELGPLSDIHGSGPAPVLMRFDEWLQVSAQAYLVVSSLAARKHSPKPFLLSLHAYSSIMVFYPSGNGALTCICCTERHFTSFRMHGRHMGWKYASHRAVLEVDSALGGAGKGLCDYTTQSLEVLPLSVLSVYPRCCRRSPAPLHVF